MGNLKASEEGYQDERGFVENLIQFPHLQLRLIEKVSRIIELELGLRLPSAAGPVCSDYSPGPLYVPRMRSALYVF